MSNELVQRMAMKRVRSVNDLGEKPLEEKRKREEFSDDKNEIGLRDKLLDEISSRQSSLESDSIHNNVDTGEQSGSNETQHFQDRKIIKLEGSLPNLALPDGWIALNHRSGGIVYLHRSTRVCTWSRPYYIGKGSVRKHDVPIAAIPCLHQAKALLNKSSERCKPSSVPPQNGDYYSAKGFSMLNFLNTTGSTENESQPNTSCYEADGSHQPVHFEEMANIKSTNKGSIIIGLATGLLKKVVHTSTEEVTSNISESPLCEENENNSCDKVKIITEDISDRSQAHEAIDTGNSNSIYHEKKNTDCKSMVKSVSDVILTASHVETDDNYCTNNMCLQKDKCEVFHPKDGLDVVNETLNEEMKEITKDDEPRPIRSINPICSSKLNPAPSLLQNTCLKSIKNDKFNHVNEEREKKKNATSTQEAYYGETHPSSAEENDLKSIELQTTFDNDIKKSQNLPKTTHQASGIELIDAGELSSYLSKLFEFEELTVDQEKNVVKPSEPVIEEGDPVLSVLECLPYCVKGKNAKENKEWVLNPGGKTPVAILHEYSQAVLKEKPAYVYSECENASKPFVAEVQINGIAHGSGAASTKKQAKQIAAEVALEVLLPDVFPKIRDYVISREKLECFDKLKIDNPNIYELSIKSGLPVPSQVLQECLKRNQGVCSSTIHFKMIPGQNQDHRFEISCGKHTAEGPCKNKKIGKQLASQALLTKLHPHISTWGSLLRIYCDRPSSILKKYKTPDEDSLSNCKSTVNAPRGQLLLARLKEKMLKIADDVNQESKYSTPSDDAAVSISTVDI